MKEYKSFYKQVGGNEGSKCFHSTRLDTYGCGCQHDCKYCYAKSLLDFRNLWNAQEPSIADIDKIKRKIDKIPNDVGVIRLGGMTDCFAPIELRHRVSQEHKGITWNLLLLAALSLAAARTSLSGYTCKSNPFELRAVHCGFSGGRDSGFALFSRNVRPTRTGQIITAHGRFYGFFGADDRDGAAIRIPYV